MVPHNSFVASSDLIAVSATNRWALGLRFPVRRFAIIVESTVVSDAV
jgi:hypothetical protein